MPKTLRTIILLILCCAYTPFFALAQNEGTFPTLFSSSEPIDIVIQADFQKLLEDTSEEPEYIEAFLIHNDEKNQTFKIKIKTRGHTRRNQSVCEFPPLKINFIKESTVNTVFEGQDKLKMVTHCNAPEEFENFTSLEYLCYKIYNILTENSYKVRPVSVTYRDTEKSMPDVEKIGFLIEDDDIMAERIGGQIYENRIWNTDSCNQSALKVFALYQFMIGNTDWWIHMRHNVDLVMTEQNGLIPVPFDFDYAGIINIPYAVPSSELPIKNVKDRFLKDVCRDGSDYDDALTLFRESKETIFSAVEESELLDKKYKKNALKYLEDFYEIINAPESFDNYLVKTCEYMNNPKSKAAK